jgi:hypothetical protein
MRVQEEIPVCVTNYFFHRLAGVLDENLPDYLLLAHNLAGGDLDICRLALGTAQRLMDLVYSLDTVADVSEVAALLRVAPQ